MMCYLWGVVEREKNRGGKTAVKHMGNQHAQGILFVFVGWCCYTNHTKRKTKHGNNAGCKDVHSRHTKHGWKRCNQQGT